MTTFLLSRYNHLLVLASGPSEYVYNEQRGSIFASFIYLHNRLTGQYLELEFAIYTYVIAFAINIGLTARYKDLHTLFHECQMSSLYYNFIEFKETCKSLKPNVQNVANLNDVCSCANLSINFLIISVVKCVFFVMGTRRLLFTFSRMLRHSASSNGFAPLDGTNEFQCCTFSYNGSRMHSRSGDFAATAACMDNLTSIHLH